MWINMLLICTLKLHRTPNIKCFVLFGRKPVFYHPKFTKVVLSFLTYEITRVYTLKIFEGNVLCFEIELWSRPFLTVVSWTHVRLGFFY